MASTLTSNSAALHACRLSRALCLNRRLKLIELGWGSFTVGTLFGILITQLVSHFMAKDRAKQDRIADRHNQAVSEFKAAFNDALINLSFQENTLAFILKQFFTDHKVAYLSFREKLSDQKKKLFDQAWSQYENYFNKNVKDTVFVMESIPFSVEIL